jgi:hypothetical protein
MTRLLGQLIPDVEPITVLLVDSLTSDFYFYIADKDVADVVDPSEAERFVHIVRSRAFNEGKGYLQVNAVD